MRFFLRSKIHGAYVTEANVNYQGSITLDRHLVNAAGMQPFEKVEIYNVTSGTRFETYVIEGDPGSGDVILNGAAAHLVKPGDKIIIACYAALQEGQILNHRPKLVFVDEKNRITALLEAEVARARVP